MIESKIALAPDQRNQDIIVDFTKQLGLYKTKEPTKIMLGIS